MCYSTLLKLIYFLIPMGITYTNTMQVPTTLRIDAVKTCQRLGECVLRTDNKTKQLWKMKWQEDMKEQISSDFGRIYLIVKRNGDENEILKIGKSECKGGMKTTFSFYQGGLGGSPSIRTFGIHHLIYNELLQNNQIEIYGIWSNPVKVMVPGLYDETEEFVCPSIHSMENKCRNEYKEIYGTYPPWNFQENATPWPVTILDKYKIQVQNRGAAPPPVPAPVPSPNEPEPVPEQIMSIHTSTYC